MTKLTTAMTTVHCTVAPALDGQYGVFATAEIAPGSTLVAAAVPLLEVVLGKTDSDKAVWAALNQLSSECVERLTERTRTLCAPRGTPPSGLARLYGVCAVNSFVSLSDDGMARMLLFDDPVTRFNHSCRPNCLHTGNGVIRSSSTVQAGAECTISYLTEQELVLPVAERRARLLTSWHFQCCCARCTLDEAYADGGQAVRRFQCLRASCHASLQTIRACGPTVGSPSIVFSPCPTCGHVVGADHMHQVLAAELELERRVYARDPDLTGRYKWDPRQLERLLWQAISRAHLHAHHWAMSYLHAQFALVCLPPLAPRHVAFVVSKVHASLGRYGLLELLLLRTLGNHAALQLVECQCPELHGSDALNQLPVFVSRGYTECAMLLDSAQCFTLMADLLSRRLWPALPDGPVQARLVRHRGDVDASVSALYIRAHRIYTVLLGADDITTRLVLHKRQRYWHRKQRHTAMATPASGRPGT